MTHNTLTKRASCDFCCTKHKVETRRIGDVYATMCTACARAFGYPPIDQQLEAHFYWAIVHITRRARRTQKQRSALRAEGLQKS